MDDLDVPPPGAWSWVALACVVATFAALAGTGIWWLRMAGDAVGDVMGTCPDVDQAYADDLARSAAFVALADRLEPTGESTSGCADSIAVSDVYAEYHAPRGRADHRRAASALIDSGWERLAPGCFWAEVDDREVLGMLWLDGEGVGTVVAFHVTAENVDAVPRQAFTKADC